MLRGPTAIDIHDMPVSWMRDYETTKFTTGIKVVQYQKNCCNHSRIILRDTKGQPSYFSNTNQNASYSGARR